MEKPGEQPRKTGQAQAQDSRFTAPSVSLPKGGGAIRGMGEKFGVNPVTGTASFSVPIAISPGRSGFGPQLAQCRNGESGCRGRTTPSISIA